MGATIVVDALWGDSGKGKVAAYAALQQKAAFCVRAGTGTNAGHSIYFEDGSEIRTHQLCCGWLHPGTQDSELAAGWRWTLKSWCVKSNDTNLRTVPGWI